MARFSKRSLANLSECHPDLVRVANEAIKHYDFVVIDGFRPEAEQMRAFYTGASKARWLQSPHNYAPAFAFDACPYPINWNDIAAFKEMGFAVLAAAHDVGVEITWGADWNRDGDLNNDRFRDLPHFELYNWRKMRG